MTIDLKKWAGLGLSTAVLGTSLVACGGEGGEDELGEGQEPQAESTMPSMDGEGEGEGGEGEGGEGEGEGGEGEGGADIGSLPQPFRLAFMAGHVEAGLALYRAGEPEMAAQHLLHPVSETHEAERAGLDAIGFDAAIFEAVFKALEEGRPAEEIEPQLAAAEANLAMMAEKAGGDPADIIRFLMETIVEEYTIAITDGAVSDPGEYQDAFGFAVVARQRAQKLPSNVDEVTAELDTLRALWPEAPIPPETPAPVGQVVAQTSRVVLALPSQ
ncbi:MAG: hypothetical protein AAGH41_08705 [Pseudomonadota bacterium]